MNPQDAWNLAYSQLELQFDRATFDTWLREATLLRVDNGVFIIGVNNTYAQEMLRHRYYRNIRRVLSDVLNKQTELKFEVIKNNAVKTIDDGDDDDMPLFRLLAEQQKADKQSKLLDQPIISNLNGDYPDSLGKHVSRPQLPDLPESELNPDLTFNRFIVSNANRMVYEAARSVSEHPGRNYNPLLIYGGSGLGKTHLLQAIAHSYCNRGMKAIYIPAEAFTNDMVAAIRNRTTAMFRERYRSADALLVDDVQFIAGKDSIQEEFFHTFNALVMYNKQIVLVTDKHPRELNLLEDRLRSRFEGGLILDIPPLEYEMRMALLQMWMQERKLQLPYAVLDMIAQRVTDNVRTLEGAFNHVVAQHKLNPGPLTINNAETALIRYDAPRTHGFQVTIDEILQVTSQHFRLSVDALVGKSRTQRVNQARQIAMYLARELTELSLPQIGEIFGGRSHTTVLHGCNKMSSQIETDPMLEQMISKLEKILIGS